MSETTKVDPIDEAAARAMADAWHGALEGWHAAAGLPFKRPDWDKEAHVWYRCARACRLAILRGMLERGPPTTLLAIYNDAYHREGDAFCHGDFKRTVSAEIEQLTKESP